MEETIGLLDKIKQHDKLSIALNKDCAIPLPDEVMKVLLQPHRLSFYYFQYIDVGSATFKADNKMYTATGGQMAFGLPNQIFTKLPYDKNMLQYALSFDDSTLALLPGTYPFLTDPLYTNCIAFDPIAQERVKIILLNLYYLLHPSRRQKKVAIILAYLHTLLTEFNSAYFEQQEGLPDAVSNQKHARYIAFTLAVEAHLTDQHDVQHIAEDLALTTNSLYRIVKEYAGVSPKEWIINRLMLEAQRKLQYSTLSVKELAYSLGFTDPGYFSRLFKKSTGKSVSAYLAALQDLSRN